MSFNGVTVEHGPLPQAELEEYGLYLAAAQLAVFGTARIAEVEANPPAPELVDELTWRVEELCTSPDASTSFGVQYRNIATGNNRALELAWNPAGTIGGFSPDVQWDGALASIGNISTGKQKYKPDTAMWPRRFAFREGMYLGREAGVPMIRRTLSHRRYSQGDVIASKPATSGEVSAVSLMLADLVKSDHARVLDVNSPVYLEVGHGLDPSGILGRRNFTTKTYIGIDRAVGDYENSLGEYAAAVLQLAAGFEHTKQSQQIKDNIYLIIGDAQELPIASGSVREVFMSNILNAPLESSTKTKMLEQARRAMGENGVLVLRANWHTNVWPINKTLGLLRKNDFYAFRGIEAGDPEYQSLELQYGSPGQVIAPDGYYVLAEPK